MELEKQVCSQPLAKRLEELGVQQDSLWYWYRNKKTDKPVIIHAHLQDFPKSNFEYSAFTVAELLNDITTAKITHDKEGNRKYSISITKYNNKFSVTLFEQDRKWGKEALVIGYDEGTIADGLAKIKIYLLENNLIKGGE